MKLCRPWTEPELAILRAAADKQTAHRMLRLAGYVRSLNAVKCKFYEVKA